MKIKTTIKVMCPRCRKFIPVDISYDDEVEG
jgi:hypothetical protein